MPAAIPTIMTHDNRTPNKHTPPLRWPPLRPLEARALACPDRIIQRSLQARRVQCWGAVLQGESGLQHAMAAEGARWLGGATVLIQETHHTRSRSGLPLGRKQELAAVSGSLRLTPLHLVLLS